MPLDIGHSHHWQTLLLQTQALAAGLPNMGLNSHKLALLQLNDLLGLAAFLKRKSVERGG